MEIWKPIAGYEGLYEISSLGRVRRIKWAQISDEQVELALDLRAQGYKLRHIAEVLGTNIQAVWKAIATPNSLGRSVHVLKLGQQRGYPSVALSKNSIVKYHRIHRLIYAAFVAPIPPDMQINHKDGNRANNDLSNLEAVTGKENTRHAFDVLGHKPTGPKGERAPKSKLTAAQVVAIRKAHARGAQIKKLAAQYGICETSMSWVVHRKSWKHIP